MPLGLVPEILDAIDVKRTAIMGHRSGSVSQLKKIETPHKVRTLNPFSSSLNIVYSFNVAIKHLIQNYNYGVLTEDSFLIEKLITMGEAYNILSKEHTSSLLKLRDKINLSLKI